MGETRDCKDSAKFHGKLADVTFSWKLAYVTSMLSFAHVLMICASCSSCDSCVCVRVFACVSLFQLLFCVCCMFLAVFWVVVCLCVKGFGNSRFEPL